MTPMARVFLLTAHRSPSDTALYIDYDTKIQIVETMKELPRAEKEQCGAFIVSNPVDLQLDLTCFSLER